MNGFLLQGQDHEIWTLWGVGQQVTKLIRKSTILLTQYPWQTPVWIHLVSSHYRFTDSRYSNLRVKLWCQFHVQKSGCLQETWLESPVSIKAFQPTDISFAFFCFMLLIWFSEALDHLMLWQIIWNDKRSCIVVTVAHLHSQINHVSGTATIKHFEHLLVSPPTSSEKPCLHSRLQLIWSETLCFSRSSVP